MVSPKTTHKPDKEAELLQKNLLEELTSIRGLFTDIMERLQSNIEAEMVACIHILSTDGYGDEKPKLLEDIKQLKMMLLSIQELKLKPKKGRLKDIRRIQDVINTLYAKLIEHD